MSDWEEAWAKYLKEARRKTEDNSIGSFPTSSDKSNPELNIPNHFRVGNSNSQIRGHEIHSAILDNMSVFASNIEHVNETPQYFRRARYPNGQVVLQAGYLVTVGFASQYIKWVPMEPVEVNNDGLTLDDLEARRKAKE